MTQTSGPSWDERYQTGNTPWDYGEVEPDLVAVAGELGLAGKSVLEIGCGTGTNAIWLARQGAEVLATDLSPTAVELARKKASGQPGIRFECSDICTTTPAPAGSIDFVFDRGVFHSVPAEARPVFARRVAEALRPGGHWLCLAGNADEDRPDGTQGPPQLRASEVVATIEPCFEIHRLARSRFAHPQPQAPQFLSWAVLMRKRKR